MSDRESRTFQRVLVDKFVANMEGDGSQIGVDLRKALHDLHEMAEAARSKKRRQAFDAAAEDVMRAVEKLWVACR
jgi:hypothetical protein